MIDLWCHRHIKYSIVVLKLWVQIYQYILLWENQNVTSTHPCNVSISICITKNKFNYPAHLEPHWKLSLIPLMRQHQAPLPCPIHTSFITLVLLLELFVYLCPLCEHFESRNCFSSLCSQQQGTMHFVQLCICSIRA